MDIPPTEHSRPDILRELSVMEWRAVRIQCLNSRRPCPSYDKRQRVEGSKQSWCSFILFPLVPTSWHIRQSLCAGGFAEADIRSDSFLHIIACGNEFAFGLANILLEIILPRIYGKSTLLENAVINVNIATKSLGVTNKLFYKREWLMSSFTMLSRGKFALYRVAWTVYDIFILFLIKMFLHTTFESLRKMNSWKPNVTLHLIPRAVCTRINPLIDLSLRKASTAD